MSHNMGMNTERSLNPSVASRYELYLKAVAAYIDNNSQSLNHFLASTSASQSEKNLIRARLAARAGNYADSNQLLLGITPETSFLRGEKHFVLANVLSHDSLWQMALIEAQQALMAYRECNYERGVFLANYNLSVYYNRLGLDDVSMFYILEAEKHAHAPSQYSLVHRARACHYIRLLSFDLAVESLEKALQLKDELDEVDKAALYSVAADVYFRSDKYELALEFIELLSRSRVVRDKARVRFDLTLLRSIQNEEPRLIDVPMPEVVAKNEEYRLRWEIVESLQDGDLRLAVERWNHLCSLFPQRFASDFKCIHLSDEKLVFIAAIRKLMKRISSTETIVLSGKPRKLFDALTSAPIPLRKEELIERVWELPYDPSLDSRFYKLIERLRKDSGLSIESVNHTYRLIS